MNDQKNIEMKFTHFKSSIEAYTVPERFPNPYNHTVHPLCQLAAEELQRYLKNQSDFQYDFDIENKRNEKNLGKMFGVLVVKNTENQIGYISAFSGFLAGKNILPHFVPPVYDILDETSEYKMGEKEIDEINRNIKDIEESEEYKSAVEDLQSAQSRSAVELEALKKSLEEGRLGRKKIRQEKRKELNEEEFTILEKELQNLSRKDKYDFKAVKQSWKERIDELQKRCTSYTDNIDKLKKIRKQKSAKLQQYIFNQYNFLNQAKEEMGVCEIFAETPQKVPPSSAGDCAAPKLLQYAFLNDLKPLALAEFWWGQLPESVVRRHGFFYSPCKGKCQPILKHMLSKTAVEEDANLNINSETLTIDILFEDDSIIVINKPPGLLSAPGTASDDSVFTRIQKRSPDATGPLIVHRLDMSTSGIMVIAKTDAAYRNLQNQFINGTVKKKYIALLDGELTSECGEINLPLISDYNERPRQRVCYESGKEALTFYKVLDVSGKEENYSKVEFMPATGRTHQIRVHAAHYKGLNTPITGDALYGQAGERLFLHAKSIEFRHPVTDKIVKFHVDEDF